MNRVPLYPWHALVMSQTWPALFVKQETQTRGSSTIMPHTVAASYQGLFQEPFASGSSTTGRRRGCSCAPSHQGAFRWGSMSTGTLVPGSHEDSLGTRGWCLGKQAYSSQMTQKYFGREETGETRVSWTNRPRIEAPQAGVKHLTLKALAKRGFWALFHDRDGLGTMIWCQCTFMCSLSLDLDLGEEKHLLREALAQCT